MSNAREETTIRSTRVLVFLLGCLLVTAVIANDAAQAGSKPGTGPDDGAGSSLSEAVPSDARHEGIQVHGHWTIEVIRRSAEVAGFAVLPRRWVVERTLAWLNRNRRSAGPGRMERVGGRLSSRRVTRSGGHVAKYLGDGVMAFFGYPEAHDNDAERAARAGGQRHLPREPLLRR